MALLPFLSSFTRRKPVVYPQFGPRRVNAPKKIKIDPALSKSVPVGVQETRLEQDERIRQESREPIRRTAKGITEATVIPGAARQLTKFGLDVLGKKEFTPKSKLGKFLLREPFQEDTTIKAQTRLSKQAPLASILFGTLDVLPGGGGKKTVVKKVLKQVDGIAEQGIKLFRGELGNVLEEAKTFKKVAQFSDDQRSVMKSFSDAGDKKAKALLKDSKAGFKDYDAYLDDIFKDEGFDAVRYENRHITKKAPEYRDVLNNQSWTPDKATAQIHALGRTKKAIEKTSKAQHVADLEEGRKISAIKQVGKIFDDWRGKILKKDAVDKAGNIRLDKIATSEDVKDVIRYTAEATEEEAKLATRGKMSQAYTQKLASQLGMTTDNLIKKEVGKAFNAEEIYASTQLLEKSADKVRKLEDLVITQGTDESIANYLQAINKHSLVQSSVAGVKAESGRALAIQKAIVKKPKETTQQLFDQVIGLYGGKKKSRKLADRLIDARKRADESGDFRGYYELIRNSNKATKADKIYEYWLNSILSGVKTHVVNTASNMLMAGKLIGERGIQAVVELPRGKARDVTFKEVGAFARGALHGISDGTTRALKVMKYGPTVQMTSKLDVKRLPAIGGKIGDIVRLPTRALIAEDEFFKAISGTAEMYAQAYRLARKAGLKGKKMSQRVADLIDSPTEEMMIKIKKTELEATFQQKLGSIGESVMSIRNKIPGMRYIIPFVRTPTNIFKEALKSTPLGLLDVGKAIKKGDTEAATKAASKAIFGSMVGAGVVYGTLAGRITGPAPKEADARDQFYGEGKLPFSIKLGDKWISLQRLEPFATVLGTVNQVTEAIQKNEDPTSVISNFVNIMAQQMKDKTFMKGLSDMFSIMNGYGVEGEVSTQFRRAVTSFVAGFIPNIAGQFTQALDPNVRDVKGDTFKEEILNTVKAKTPWLSKSVPGRFDVFGEEIKRPGGPLSRFLSPVPIQTETDDPVRIEMNNLGVDFGFPTRAKSIGGIKKIKEGGIKKTPKLSLETYRNYINITGQIGHARLTQLITDPRYQKLTDDDKIDIFSDIMTDTRTKMTKQAVGELLLDISGLEKTTNPKVLGPLNLLYSEMVQSKAWKNMNDDEKLQMFMDDYTTLLIRNP